MARDCCESVMARDRMLTTRFDPENDRVGSNFRIVVAAAN